MSTDLTTVMVLEALAKHIETAPQNDLGMNPSDDAHREQGTRWHLWNQQRRAYETILAPRLIREALENR